MKLAVISHITLAKKRILWLSCLNNCWHASLIFSFLSVVKFSFISTELMTNPIKVAICEGINFDLSGWILNPDFVNRVIVSMTLLRHSSNVLPMLNMSSM